MRDETDDGPACFRRGRNGGIDIAVCIHAGVFRPHCRQLFDQQPRQILLFLRARKRLLLGLTFGVYLYVAQKFLNNR